MNRGPSVLKTPTCRPGASAIMSSLDTLSGKMRSPGISATARGGVFAAVCRPHQDDVTAIDHRFVSTQHDLRGVTSPGTPNAVNDWITGGR
ncbi:hypothetical protein ASG11_14395 [Sphingomonas sp. Leaf357]|nr:hypothetical protein ASG11_14395 [Sphingomonas sp. Leaf357]